MYPLIIATAAILSCSEAQDITDGLIETSLDLIIKQEVITEIIKVSPSTCVINTQGFEAQLS